MRKRPFSVEWHVAESDAEWDAIRTQQAVTPPPEPRAALRRWLGTLVLLAVVGGGGWYWQSIPALSENNREQDAVAQTTVEISATVALSRTTSADIVPLPPRQEIFTSEVVRMLEHPEEGLHAYQQTTGPLRELLKGALGGAERELETTYFRVYFRQRDEQTIRAAVPQLDHIYKTFQENLGVAPPFTTDDAGSDKLVLQISEAYQQADAPYRTYDIDLDAPLVVSSPALYPAIGTWTAADLFTQSVALSLLDRFLTTAVEHYGFGTARDPVINGFRLWQLWSLPLPLSEEKRPLIQWLYQEFPGGRADTPIALPATYTDLCALHGLWMAHPAHLHIPLLCTPQDRSPHYLAAWRTQPPPTTLPWLNTPHYIDEEAGYSGRVDTPVHPGAAIALATVVEYIVSTHGHAALPEFLRNVGRYDSWDELIPGQFGMTTTEFEAAWQKFIQS